MRISVLWKLEQSNIQGHYQYFGYWMNRSIKLLNDMEILGRKIREARKQRGLLQSQLAELATVRRQVVGEIERGTYKGSFRQVLSILRAMGLRLTLEPVRFPTLDELSDE
jgi:DNA-binding XRE family transcriptional regulator